MNSSVFGFSVFNCEPDFRFALQGFVAPFRIGEKMIRTFAFIVTDSTQGGKQVTLPSGFPVLSAGGNNTPYPYYFPGNLSGTINTIYSVSGTPFNTGGGQVPGSSPPSSLNCYTLTLDFGDTIYPFTGIIDCGPSLTVFTDRYLFCILYSSPQHGISYIGNRQV
jgi:hypothetical protein